MVLVQLGKVEKLFQIIWQNEKVFAGSPMEISLYCHKFVCMLTIQQLRNQYNP